MINGIIWILKTIKNIILFFIKQIFIFSFRLVLFFLFILGVIVFLQNYRDEEKAKHRSGEYSYIELDMGRKFSEGSGKFLGNILDEEREYLQFLKDLREIESDEKIKGLIFKLDSFSLNSVQSEEIGGILKSMREKKEIYSYSTGFERGNYYFASYTKNILMPPADSATSILAPYSAEIPYYKGLADKMGVKFQVVNTGNYKSMGESLTSNKMSQYTRENHSMILNESYENFLKTVSENRKIDREILQKKIENGEYVLINPAGLKEEKLIDKEVFYHNFIKELGEKSVITFEEYSKNRENRGDKSENESQIGIITLSGEIRESSLDKGEEWITPKRVEALLKNAMEDDKIKGIILRIDSPGGSALASEIIHNMIVSYEKKKPIYISMGRVAASGGYYIATAGDRIYLNKNTITGSIGVVSIIPSFKELVEKVGINIERIEKGKNSNVYSLFEPMDKMRIEAVLKSSERVYAEFKTRVSENRNLTMEQVEEVAAGRVWLGERAIEKGLADGIATLEEVGTILGEELGLESYTLVKVDEENVKGEILGIFRKIRNLSTNMLNSLGVLRVFNSGNTLHTGVINISENLEREIQESQVLYKPLYYYPEKLTN